MDFYFIIFLAVIAFDKVVLVEKVELVARFASFRLFWVFIFVTKFQECGKIKINICLLLRRDEHVRLKEI